VRLDSSFDSFMVVTKAADGKLKMDCVDGEKSANTKVQATPTGIQVKKEAANDK